MQTGKNRKKLGHDLLWISLLGIGAVNAATAGPIASTVALDAAADSLTSSTIPERTVPITLILTSTIVLTSLLTMRDIISIFGNRSMAVAGRGNPIDGHQNQSTADAGSSAGAGSGLASGGTPIDDRTDNSVTGGGSFAGAGTMYGLPDTLVEPMDRSTNPLSKRLVWGLVNIYYTLVVPKAYLQDALEDAINVIQSKPSEEIFKEVYEYTRGAIGFRLTQIQETYLRGEFHIKRLLGQAS